MLIKTLSVTFSMIAKHSEDITEYEVKLVEARNATITVTAEKQRLQHDLEKQLSVADALKGEYSDKIVTLQTKLSMVQQELIR